MHQAQNCHLWAAVEAHRWFDHADPSVGIDLGLCSSHALEPDWITLAKPWQDRCAKPRQPNLATMLVYILTDIAVPRSELRPMLARAVDASFNAISIDSDTSTSDTVVALSSARVP
ncbi:MAG: bifunctional ornithine acetyltransferase/N-acetylglutamate synthase, partial [Roseiflexaceae bacterium]|nr:bifunctional ornithine acetyltransferase/N-acetylglutamate synthase [Roseiflexaceae bacterium]